MEMSKMYRWIVVSVLVFSTYAVSEEKQQLLAAQDVSKVMEQILSQHVSQKAVTADIIRKSFLIYIDQFDPNRIYLLESEVSPYTNMSNAEANAILEKYKRNDFSEYEKLNGVIQNAIQRAETTRKDFEQSEFQIAEGVKNPAELEAAEVYPSFAATLSDLQTRQKQHFKNYIASERRHYGDSIVKKREDRLLKLYDQHQTEHENQYLFVKADGIHLTVEEQENIITLHILKALTKSLDAHTSFFNADEAYDMRVRLEKGFDGVGIVLRQSGDIYMVSKLIPNSTAEKSGLVRVGDVIEKVDGASVSSESLHEVMQKLRGKNGTKVQLELKRNMIIAGVPTDKTFNISLKRESIVINEGRVETSYEKFGNGIIGTIKLHSFYQGTNGISSEQDVKDAIKKLDKEGNLRGLILDLRDNSGGFLTQAVKVAGLFITNGVVVVSQYSNGDKHYYRDMDGKVDYEGPLVILTSRATASAAEIVAQALQDYGLALVVGDEQTYGKGTIQSQTVTDEGEGSTYFKVTVGKYYTVSGKTPELHGVRSDIIIPSSKSLDQMGEEYIEYNGRDYIEPSYNDNLHDIDPDLKPWYLRYYTPTLQRPTKQWRELLPTLKKNSEYRIKNNKHYQEYLLSKEENATNGVRQKTDDDPQLHEAINVVKDMVIMESRLQEENLAPAAH